MSIQPKRAYTLAEYLELEKTSDEKLEFWDGNVWSMSGASLAHNRIVRNLNTEIDLQLRRTKNCSVFPSDLRIKVPAYPPYRYPDLTALCGEPEIEKASGIDILVNPQLIVEVLSGSTEAFDRGDKFTYYKSIPTFIEYILVAQHRPHVSQFIKQNDWWINFEFNNLSDTVKLKFASCELSLTEIYRDIDFESI